MPKEMTPEERRRFEITAPAYFVRQTKKKLPTFWQKLERWTYQLQEKLIT